MGLRWDRVLDRAWLALASAAAVTVAVHEGGAVGRRAWTLGAGGAARQVDPRHGDVPEARGLGVLLDQLVLLGQHGG
ncbi:hypothetical protein JRF84_34090, partial [Methylobacterium organophilum]|uniref:hypothetical protein n=1 Tax=Methylobacterium organophilum TaxID=410 RepID=UPI0019CF7EB3